MLRANTKCLASLAIRNTFTRQIRTLPRSKISRSLKKPNIQLSKSQELMNRIPDEEKNRVRRVLESNGINDDVEKYLVPNENIKTNDEMDDYQRAVGLLGMICQEIMESQDRSLEKKRLQEIWASVEAFRKVPITQGIDPPLQELVVLFQVAKDEKNAKHIKLVGDLLYRYQLVRLDPFNEVSYLTALSKTKSIGRAIDIWKSRLSKDDVKNSVWWYEVGICLLQDAHLLIKAESLALRMKEKFSYVSPKVCLRFVKRYLDISKTEKAWEWYQYMLDQVKANGFGDPEYIQGDLTPEEAALLFNKKIQPSQSDMLTTLVVFIKEVKLFHSVQVIKDLQQFKVDIPVNVILSALRIFSKNISKVSDEHIKQFFSLTTQFEIKEAKDLLMTTVLQDLAKANPKLLDTPEFYEIWIATLANLNEIDIAFKVFKSMLDRNISPSLMVVHTLLKSLLSRNKLHFAFKFLETLEGKEYSQENIKFPKPTAIHYALFIQYGARRNKRAFVETILKRMENLNVKHDQTSYMALIYFRYRSRDFNGIFEILNTPGMQYSQESYNAIWSMISDFYRSGYATPASIKSDNQQSQLINLDLDGLFLKMLKTSAFKPSLESYAKAASAMIRANKIPSALAVTQYASEINGLQLNGRYGYELHTAAKKLATTKRYSVYHGPDSVKNWLGMGNVQLLESIEVTPDLITNAVCEILHINYSDIRSEVHTRLKNYSGVTPSNLDF